MISRRYLTFSLRALFVLTTALAVWLGIVVNRAREQREAVKAIEALGGTVTYDWEPGLYDSIGDDPAGPSGPAWLRRLVGDEHFQEVTMVGFPVVYGKSVPKPLECIPYLRRLQGLETVVLWSRSFSNSEETQSELHAALPNCDVRIMPQF